MQLRKAKALLWLVILAHIVLALSYSFVTPYLKSGTSNGQALPDISAPDEFAHVRYVAYLMDKHELPVLNRGIPTPDDYESHQPPLYYLIGAAVETAAGQNPRTESGGKLLRALNSLYGAITVAGIFFMALWATDRPKLALFSSALIALMPMFCVLSGAVSNDALLYACSAWCVAFLVRAVRFGWSGWQALAVGLIAGIAMLTKTSALVLMPVIVFALVGARPKLTTWLIAILVPLAMVLPLWLRNHQLYGDPLALSAFRQRWPSDVHFSGPRSVAHWAYVLVIGCLVSFVGEFGYMDINLPNWIYVVFIATFLICLFAGIVCARKVLAKPVRWVIGVDALAVLAAYVAFNITYVQPQARYLFPAAGPIAIWIALGIGRLGPGRGKWLGAAILTALVLTNLYALSILPAEFAKRMTPAKTSFNFEISVVRCKLEGLKV